MSIQYQGDNSPSWSAPTVPLWAFGYTGGRLDRGRAPHAPLPKVLNKTTGSASSLQTNRGTSHAPRLGRQGFLGKSGPALNRNRPHFLHAFSTATSDRSSSHRSHWPIETSGVPSLHGLSSRSTRTIHSEIVSHKHHNSRG